MPSRGYACRQYKKETLASTGAIIDRRHAGFLTVPFDIALTEFIALCCKQGMITDTQPRAVEHLRGLRELPVNAQRRSKMSPTSMLVAAKSRRCSIAVCRVRRISSSSRASRRTLGFSGSRIHMAES